MNRLIINADDFGLTDGVNRGIIDCHKAGTVTSTTLMVNGEEAAAAAALAADNPGLGVGLHINLTSGPPTLPPERVASLVGRDGCFPGAVKMIARLSTATVDRGELDAEVSAQIEACRALGVEPTHVDSHHHMHAHPVVGASLSRVCPPAGITKERGYALAPHSPKALAIRLSAALAGRAGRLATPDRFAGIEEMGRRDVAELLTRELAAEGDLLEYMCHPGYLDQDLRRVSSYSDLRQVELEAMLSDAVASAIERSGALLVNYRDINR